MQEWENCDKIRFPNIDSPNNLQTLYLFDLRVDPVRIHYKAVFDVSQYWRPNKYLD